jgi:hypothetical protein
LKTAAGKNHRKMTGAMRCGADEIHTRGRQRVVKARRNS